MRALFSLLTNFTAWLCAIFDVTPDSITPKEDRRGNMPPPSGGISSH